MEEPRGGSGAKNLLLGRPGGRRGQGISKGRRARRRGALPSARRQHEATGPIARRAAWPRPRPQPTPHGLPASARRRAGNGPAADWGERPLPATQQGLSLIHI
eukprot:3153511-Alexandrium_andersonii.AAC.1